MIYICSTIINTLWHVVIIGYFLLPSLFQSSYAFLENIFSTSFNFMWISLDLNMQEYTARGIYALRLQVFLSAKCGKHGK